jgi:flagellar biosynthesis activator protein FlaF
MRSSELETYRNVQKASMTDRALEAYVLTQAAQKLKDCQDNWDTGNVEKLDEALRFNQIIWSIFQGELVRADNPLPGKLRQDLLNLSLFTDKRTFEIMAYPSPEKLTAIININLNIAAGLRSCLHFEEQKREVEVN